MDIGKIIRKKRKEMGFTQTELALRSEVSFGTIVRIEHGYLPTMENLERILEILKIRISYEDINVEKINND